VDGGDRFSDVDLTFGIADHVPVADVLDDWTRTLIDELDAVHLADLERGPTTYRVFLLPDALQFDLSMTPAARFRPAGPRFRLLDSTMPTLARSSLMRSGEPSPPPFLRSCARVRRRVYRTRLRSRSGSLSFAEAPQLPRRVTARRLYC
jgi:hypothetical protein